MWADVDWERKLLHIHAPKTESQRTVPISPELLAILEETYDAAEIGTEKVITLSRNNRHRVFKAIIKKAGLTPWPRLFQTLRQSCETDFAKRCPQHAVSRWMGQDDLGVLTI